MKYQNIFYICGNNSYLCELDKQKNVKNFREKYGAESIEFLSLNNPEAYHLYASKLMTMGIFEEKRMFVFSGGKKSEWRKNSKKKQNEENFAKNLEKIAEQISASDFLIFCNIEKSDSELISWLENNATKREHNISFTANSWKKFFDLSEKILQKTLNLYADGESTREKWQNNEFLWHAIADTLDKITILEKSWTEITNEIILECSQEYEWKKIFDFIDAIMAANVTRALEMSEFFRENLDNKTIDAFFGTFIGTLRKNMYILQMMDAGLSKPQIIHKLPGMSPFMIDKCSRFHHNSKKLQKFFPKIINANIASKSGKLVWENILWRFFEIDTALFELKK